MKNKPDWLPKKKLNIKELVEMEKMLSKLSLNTVCQGAMCPNIGECFKNKTATFMILGDICTRNCKFCAVGKGKPKEPDIEEPKNLAKAAKELGLKHIVITSVTRDDLEDGGAEQFAKCIYELRKVLPKSTIEVLIPDFKGNIDALKIVTDAKPEIINHNIETVPSLYGKARPMADYEQSLKILKTVKELDPKIFTKAGLMLGLGETDEELYKVMDDLREIDCDILTLGQYLRPSKEHIEIKEYVRPEKFEEYKRVSLEKGFKYTASGTYVRSSYHAGEGMDLLLTGNK